MYSYVHCDLVRTVRVILEHNGGLLGIQGSGQWLPHYFNLEYFQFRWGPDNNVAAGHTIDGHKYPMEVSRLYWHDLQRTEEHVALKTNAKCLSRF